MPTLPLIITDVGRQAIIDETNQETLPVTISHVAIGTGTWSPDATATALQNQIKLLPAVGALGVAADTIHVTCTDESTDTYNLGEIGLYTDGGVLFAIYAPGVGTYITAKAADALLLLAADVVLTSVPPGTVDVNGIGFSNPPATEAAPGIAKLATQALVDVGLDDETIVTPLKLETRLSAAIAAILDSAPGTLDTLNELAAALGDDPNFATTVTNAIAGKQPFDNTLTALAAVATAANKLIYATGVDTFATTTLSAFMRTLLDDGDAATARATLGLSAAISDSGKSLSSNGYQKLSNGFIIQWGNGDTTPSYQTGLTVTYPIAFPNAALVALTGSRQIGRIISSLNVTNTTFTAYATDVGGTFAAGLFNWIAIGY